VVALLERCARSSPLYHHPTHTHTHTRPHTHTRTHTHTQAEQSAKERRQKEKQEAHLYCNVRIATDEDMAQQVRVCLAWPTTLLVAATAAVQG
jgi:hypothetical protein